MLTKCARLAVPEEVWDVLTAADLAKQGSWPTLAGWIDQPASLVEAVRFVWSLQDQWEHKLGIKN